jgi:hypothetical protein
VTARGPVMLLVSTTSSSEATSMSDASSVLSGLEKEFRVLEVTGLPCPRPDRVADLGERPLPCRSANTALRTVAAESLCETVTHPQPYLTVSDTPQRHRPESRQYLALHRHLEARLGGSSIRPGQTGVSCGSPDGIRTRATALRGPIRG